MKIRFMLLLALLLLSACTSRNTSNLSCTSVACRPQSGASQLVIWWPPELRNSAADYTRVTVNQ